MFVYFSSGLILQIKNIWTGFNFFLFPRAERKIFKFVYLLHNLRVCEFTRDVICLFPARIFFEFAFLLDEFWFCLFTPSSGSNWYRLMPVSLIFNLKLVRRFLSQNLPKFFATTQRRFFPSPVSFPLLWTIIYSILLYFINIFINIILFIRKTFVKFFSFQD